MLAITFWITLSCSSRWWKLYSSQNVIQGKSWLDYLIQLLCYGILVNLWFILENKLFTQIFTVRLKINIWFVCSWSYVAKILQFIFYIGLVVHLPFKFYACRILLDLRMIIWKITACVWKVCNMSLQAQQHSLLVHNIFIANN